MSEMQRERDLVLKPNEYAYILDKTNGRISCAVGPYTISLSTSSSLVNFVDRPGQEKRFEEVSFNEAVHVFLTAPENWYITLKNPVLDSNEGNAHPNVGASNPLPKLNVGKKINITGPESFALYPGQMAKLIQGHRLHKNQYLLVRVYDSTEINLNKISTEDDVATGQLAIIKGTDTQFYIPPTGIEVVPVGGYGDVYVRDAVTLEKLEYCILIDEKGNKEYKYGPNVVFPEPDQKFIKNDNSFKFKAIELSEISGVYIKVISDYTDEADVEHKIGEELFITGKDQNIYYPRAEHAIIDYDGKIVHHAIAIPAGEGRYILNRMNGEIKTIKGPCMYLPDPRKEVVTCRILTEKQCDLWYPGNNDVLLYNRKLAMEHSDNKDKDACIDGSTVADYTMDFISTHDIYGEMGVEGPKGIRGARGTSIGDPRGYTETTSYSGCGMLEYSSSSKGVSRKTSYTKPRTVILNNQYSGTVNIDIWTGYAVNVISKKGTRKVVVGPQTYIMEYDESLEILELSTGKPKTTDNLLRTVYLRTDNNKISDIINIQTKDFVDVAIKVSLCVDFDQNYKDKWFSVENYVKYLTDRIRSIVKRVAKKYTIEEFYENGNEIVRNTILAIDPSAERSDDKVREGRLFKENGMFLYDVDVLSIKITDDTGNILDEHQKEMVRKSLELSNARRSLEVSRELGRIDIESKKVEYDTRKYLSDKETELENIKITNKEKIEELKRAAIEAEKKAELELQAYLDEINAKKLERQKAEIDLRLDEAKRQNELEMVQSRAHAKSIIDVIGAVSPDLIASMDNNRQATLMAQLATSMSPYAIAGDESVVDVTDKLLRGTPFDGLLQKLVKKD